MIAIQRLELCFLDIWLWKIKHKLKLDDEKTEFITLLSHDNKEINCMKIQIGQETIVALKHVCNLGLIIDSMFNMDNHITSVR